MKRSISSDEALDILLLIRRTADILRTVRRHELVAHDVTPEHAAVLSIVSTLGGSARPMDISLWLFRKRQSVHDLLDRMERAGLLEKAQDPERKNGVLVVLTDQGRVLHEQTSKLAAARRIIASLSKRQRQQLRTSLDVLLRTGQKEAGVEDNLPLRPLTPRS
jgi:DNA-binding MarR family transcriptional regulator